MSESSKRPPEMVLIKTISAEFKLPLGEKRTVEADIEVNGSAVKFQFDNADVAKRVTQGLAIGSVLPLQELAQGIIKAFTEYATKLSKELEEANAESYPTEQKAP